jgi:hypothetical protein
MSKKETRRAVRQAFPKAKHPPAARTAGGNRYKSSTANRGRVPARQALRPPSWKRALIQGAVVAVLYLIVIRFVWRQEGSGWGTYIIFPVAGFFIYTGIAYSIDKYTYQRRLRRLNGSSK